MKTNKIRILTLIFTLIMALTPLTMTGCSLFGSSKIDGTYTGVMLVGGQQGYAKAILNNGNIEIHMGYIYGDDDYVAFGTYTVSDNVVKIRWNVSGNEDTYTIDKSNNNLITSTGVILRKTT